jgi:hypothetical protein
LASPQSNETSTGNNVSISWLSHEAIKRQWTMPWLHHEAPCTFLPWPTREQGSRRKNPTGPLKSTMNSTKWSFLPILAVFAATPADAQELWQDGWIYVPGLNASKVAMTKGAKLISSGGHSWPDGRQATMTYWQLGDLFLRCVDHFDKNMVATGGLCSQPKR